MESVAVESPKSTNLDADSSKSVNVSLLVLMGLPASGKSTLANKLQNFCTTCGVVVVSFDHFIPLPIQVQIIQDLTSCNDAETLKADDDNNDNALLKANLSTGKVLRKKFLSCVDMLVKFAKEICESVSFSRASLMQEHLLKLTNILGLFESSNLVSDVDFVNKTEVLVDKLMSLWEEQTSQCKNLLIVVDDNNYYSSMRNDFYQIAKLSEIGFCIIYCQAALKVCVQRNSSRDLDSQVHPKAIVEMSLKFEEPNPLQNPCDIYCLSVNTDADAPKSAESEDPDLNLTLLDKVICSSFLNPLKKNKDRTDEIERERRICSENEVHQADLLLRKWISKKINLSCLGKGIGSKSGIQSNSDFKKKLSSDLNLKKKQALEKLRSGELKVSYDISRDVEFREEIISMFENISLQ